MKKDQQIITKPKPFIGKYDWEERTFSSENKWFEKIWEEII